MGVEVLVDVVVVVVVVVLVMVVMMDLCVTVGLMQYTLLSTCPSKKLYLTDTASFCRAGRLEYIILF